MKKIHRLKSPWGPLNLSVWLALAIGLWLVAGCRKSPVAATALPVAADPAAAPAGAQPNPDDLLAQLTLELRKYSFEQRRVPASFNELVAAARLDPVPVAPAGKKFAIDPKAVQVILVNP